MARERMPLKLGLRLDVLDNEGIWNTGVIVDVAQDDDKDDELVEIKYDGWGDEYNEWVAVSAQRLAPLHMFTIVKKCWAKLTKWPWWPAFVVLRAPTKRGAIESLEAETKVFVEFFDSFDEDKRSRCWMQRKSVVSFDDNFEERAAKNVGKNFHKFVEATQRALASSSPLLFVGAGTLPIEYSSKSPLTYTAQKQKLGASEWHDAYTSFSDRYRLLYGLEAAAKQNDDVAAAAATEDAEVAGDTVYADEESEEQEEAEEEEASAGEDDVDDEEATESVRGRHSARSAASRKRTLPARASTRRNAQKRVKAIELLLQSSTPSQHSSSSAVAVKSIRRAASTSALPVKLETSAPASVSSLSALAREQQVVSAPPLQRVAETPIILLLDDNDNEHDAAAPTTAGTANATASGSNHDGLTAPADVSSLANWEPGAAGQIYIIGRDDVLPARSESFLSPAASVARSASDTPVKKAPAVSNSSPSSLPSPSLHRRKLPRTSSATFALHHAVSSSHLTAVMRSGDTSHHIGGGKTEVIDVNSGDIDADDAQFWSGGSRYEVENEPWAIQRWLLHGLKQKLAQS